LLEIGYIVLKALSLGSTKYTVEQQHYDTEVVYGMQTVLCYGDSVSNAVEENSGIFSLIQTYYTVIHN